MTSVPILPHVRWLLRSVKARYRRLQLRWCSQPCRASTVSFRSKRPAVADLTINPLAYPRPHPASLNAHILRVLYAQPGHTGVFSFLHPKLWKSAKYDVELDATHSKKKTKWIHKERWNVVSDVSSYAADMQRICSFRFSSFLIQSPYCYFWNYVMFGLRLDFLGNQVAPAFMEWLARIGSRFFFFSTFPFAAGLLMTPLLSSFVMDLEWSGIGRRVIAASYRNGSWPGEKSIFTNS